MQTFLESLPLAKEKMLQDLPTAAAEAIAHPEAAVAVAVAEVTINGPLSFPRR